MEPVKEYPPTRYTPEDIAGEEWGAWYRLTGEERFRESAKILQTYLQMGGSLDPELDFDSPFFDREEWRQLYGHGRSSVRVVRRG